MIYWSKRYHQRHDVCVGMLSKSPKDSQFDSQFNTYIWHSKNAVNLILIYNTFIKKTVHRMGRFLVIKLINKTENSNHYGTQRQSRYIVTKKKSGYKIYVTVF